MDEKKKEKKKKEIGESRSNAGLLLLPMLYILLMPIASRGESSHLLNDPRMTSLPFLFFQFFIEYMDDEPETEDLDLEYADYGNERVKRWNGGRVDPTDAGSSRSKRGAGAANAMRPETQKVLSSFEHREIGWMCGEPMAEYAHVVFQSTR